MVWCVLFRGLALEIGNIFQHAMHGTLPRSKEEEGGELQRGAACPPPPHSPLAVLVFLSHVVVSFFRSNAGRRHRERRGKEEKPQEQQQQFDGLPWENTGEGDASPTTLGEQEREYTTEDPQGLQFPFRAPLPNGGSPSEAHSRSRKKEEYPLALVRKSQRKVKKQGLETPIVVVRDAHSTR